jgi:hypothetical protein
MKILNRKLREGPIVPADNPRSVRDDILRGARDSTGQPFKWAHNDTRPGLQPPVSRKDMVFSGPQATTAPDTGFVLDPAKSLAGATARPGLTKLGTTTTQTPGFGKISPSGTGLLDQSEFALRRLRALRGPTQ